MTKFVRNDRHEVFNLMCNLEKIGGEHNLLKEMFYVMSTDALGEVLEDVAKNWDVEVTIDGEVKF